MKRISCLGLCDNPWGALTQQAPPIGLSGNHDQGSLIGDGL
jgi:hypothetical protein